MLQLLSSPFLGDIMMMPPQGGLPSPLMQAPPNVGMAVQQGNHGNIAAAMVKVSNAVKMLEEALPLIPMGDQLHTEILNAAKGLSKHMKQGESNPQLEQQSLIQQLKNNQGQSQMAALARQFGAQAGQGQPPAAA